MLKASHSYSGSGARFLLGLWLTMALVRLLASLPIRKPSIFTDELTYWQMARSFSADGTFLFHGKPYDIPSILYSILLSPLFRLTSDSAAFDWARLVNALVMAAVAFPAYGFAREVLNERAARWVAMLTLLLPGGVYAALIMAENLYFPLFVLCAWLLFRTLVYGRVRDASLSAAALPLCYLTKPHALVLLVAYGLLCIAWLFLWVRRAPGAGGAAISREALVRGIPWGGTAAIVALRGLQADRGLGGSVTELLGGRVYASFLLPTAKRPEAWVFLVAGLSLLTVLALGMGIVPAGALCPSHLKGERSERWGWIAALGAVTASGYVLLVTRHTVLFDAAPQLHERYLFVVIPIFLVLLLREGALAGICARTTTVFASAALVALIGVRPERVLTWNIQTDSPSLCGFFVIWRHFPGRTGILGVALVFCVAIGVIFSWLRRGKRAGPWALAGLLAAMNVGWYVQQYEGGRDLRTKEFAEAVRRELKPGDRLAVVVDGLDITIVWTLEFWIRERLVLYSSNAAGPAWWHDDSGSLQDVFKRTGATLVVVATDMEAQLTGHSAAVLRRRTLSTPVSVLRRGLAAEQGEAAFETDPGEVVASYAVIKPLKEMALDATAVVEVEVRNVGRRAWPAEGPTPVRFGYHWADPDRRKTWQSVVWDDGSRTGIDKDVKPGEAVRLRIRVKAPPERGPSWRLVIAPRIEGIANGWVVKELLTFAVRVE